MTKPAELVHRIEMAFARMTWPGNDALTSSTYGEEPAALVEAFADKDHWQSLDAAFLDPAPDGWGTALSFFSHQAFVFYLPAYLRADLRDELQIQDPAAQLCLSVTPQAGARKIAKIWGGGTMVDHARQRFSGLSAEQVSVIVDYLWWKLDHLGPDIIIEQALEYYWLPRAEAANDPNPT